MSTIIDEIKKLNQYMNFNEEITVKLSDTEAILARCTCENCKHSKCIIKKDYFSKDLSKLPPLASQNQFRSYNMWENKDVS